MKKIESKIRDVVDVLIIENLVSRHGVVGWKRIYPDKALLVRSGRGFSGVKGIGVRILSREQEKVVRRGRAKGLYLNHAAGVFFKRASQVARGIREPAAADNVWDIACGSWCWNHEILN